MTDDGRPDIERGLMDVERDLKRLEPLAAPMGLRQRVMDQAAEARKGSALSPGMRVAAAACSIIIVIALGLDPLIRKHETARLAALLDGRPLARPAGEPAADIVEALGGPSGEARRMVRLRLAAAAAARTDREHQVTEAWRRLKGWLADEASEDLI